MNILAIKIKNKEGAAAASNKSSEAYIYAVVANVSKLNGLKINVIVSSLIISNDIKIPTNKIEFLKYGMCTFINVLIFEYPNK